MALSSMHPSWQKQLLNHIDGSYFSVMNEFIKLQREKSTVYPAPSDVFKAFEITPFEDIKVVILGQDPYHNPNQAHGLSFSVLPPTQPPPSLVNIFKELENDIPDWEAPLYGDLTPWTQRGVFLLNTILTVRQNEPKSHQGNGWEQLTQTAIKLLSDRGKCVFILWGKPAQENKKFIDLQNNAVLASVHPSPLSAHGGFFGSKPFSKANTILKSWGKDPVDWNLG